MDVDVGGQRCGVCDCVLLRDDVPFDETEVWLFCIAGSLSAWDSQILESALVMITVTPTCFRAYNGL